MYRRIELFALGQKRGGGQHGHLENNVHMFSHLEQKRGVLPMPSKVCVCCCVPVEACGCPNTPEFQCESPPHTS